MTSARISVEALIADVALSLPCPSSNRNGRPDCCEKKACLLAHRRVPGIIPPCFNIGANMKALEVLINGQRVCLAGVGNGVVCATVDSVGGPDREDDLFLH